MADRRDELSAKADGLLKEADDGVGYSAESRASMRVASGLYAIAAELSKANDIAEGRLIEVQMARRDG